MKFFFQKTGKKGQKTAYRILLKKKKMGKKREKNPYPFQEGFSLVELAVALIIVGLMVAFALKGHEIYQNAKLQSIVTQVDHFRLAHMTFSDRYTALPGDFEQASLLLGNGIQDGDGDGIIYGLGLDPAADTYRYWQHLKGAGLLHTPLNADNIPTSKLGGVFTVDHNGEESRPGIWYVLGGSVGYHGDKGLLTPQQAYALNKKFDDGCPSSGRLRSETGRGSVGSCLMDNQESYNLQETAPVCVMYFQL